MLIHCEGAVLSPLGGWSGAYRRWDVASYKGRSNFTVHKEETVIPDSERIYKIKCRAGGL